MRSLSIARDVHVKASARVFGLSPQPECQQFASNGVAFGLYCMCGDIHSAGYALALNDESAASKFAGP